MRRHRQDINVISEMNLTNLLDTAFVLVLALMMVAPSLKHGIAIELPAPADASTLSTEPKTLTIVLAPSQGEGLSDRIYIEDVRVTLDEMETIITERRRLDPKLDVLVEGDKSVRLDTFLGVVSRLQAMGLEGIGLPTEPVDTTRVETNPDPRKSE